MKKGINLQAKLHIGADPAAATRASSMEETLPALFARANPGLQLTVKHLSAVDAAGNAALRVYIEGEQDPAADFAALTRGALNKAIAAMNEGAAPPSSDTPSGSGVQHSGVHITDVREMEGDEEDTGVTLAPNLQAQAATPASGSSQTQATQAPPAATASAATTAEKPWWAFWKRKNNS